MQERNLCSQGSFRSNCNLEMFKVFEERGKPRGLLEKSLPDHEQKERTNNKLNPSMANHKVVT